MRSFENTWDYNCDYLVLLKITWYYLGLLGITCNYLGLIGITLYFLGITWGLLCNYKEITCDSETHLGLILILVSMMHCSSLLQIVYVYMCMLSPVCELYGTKTEVS